MIPPALATKLQEALGMLVHTAQGGLLDGLFFIAFTRGGGTTIGPLVTKKHRVRLRDQLMQACMQMHMSEIAQAKPGLPPPIEATQPAPVTPLPDDRGYVRPDGLWVPTPTN